MAYVALFRELWRYAGKDRSKVVLYIFLHFCSALTTLATPLVFARILNSLQTLHGQALLQTVGRWTLAWAGLFIWFNLFHRVGRYFEFDVAYRIKQRFLNRYYGIATRLPLRWHTDHHSGETIDRINLASNALFQFSLTQFIYLEQFMAFWGSLVALAVLSWRISILAFAVAIATLVSIQLFDRRLVGIYKSLNQVNHRVAATLYDYISNIKTIITLRLGERTSKELDARLANGYAPFMHAETWVNAMKWLCVTLFMMALQVGTIFFYIWLQLTKGATVMLGNVAAVFQYLQQLSNTFANIAREYQQMIYWRSNYQAVLSIDGALPTQTERPPAPADWKRIEISDLSFRYGKKQTLDHVSLDLRRGERIALVGESGSGKSSLMALLRGLYEAQEGRVSVDGQTLPELAMLGDLTTLIPQEPEIFENSILYNLTIGLDYALASVTRALRIACFQEVVERLPLGLETDVRERGVTLSGGERQRLALARGILAAEASSLLLMDEPTSSVDVHNEQRIYENVFEAFPNSTIISSIHRLHLLHRFDRVVVMEAGRVVQAGTLASLQREPGRFRDLWTRYTEAAARGMEETSSAA